MQPKYKGYQDNPQNLKGYDYKYLTWKNLNHINHPDNLGSLITHYYFLADEKGV